MITPHIPKLSQKKFLLFFSLHRIMSGKNLNFDDKNIKKVTLTKISE